MYANLVVVADASRARIFRSDAKLSALEQVKALDHAASRMRTSDLVTGGQTAMLGHHDPAEMEHQAFAREVMDFVVHSVETQSLVLVAPPRFLGSLRQLLPAELVSRVVLEIHHDYTHTPTKDLPALLQKHAA